MTNSHSLAIRKLVTVVEEIYFEARPNNGEPLRKVAIAAVFENPYAGQPFSQDLTKLIEPSAKIGALLGSRAAETLGVPVESYGKAAVVGVAGEQEHGVACKTSVFGGAIRPAIGDAVAPPPSVSKRCSAGTSVDIPLCFKDDVFVRSHYDGMTVTVADAPLPNEIMMILAVASGPRVEDRLGGWTKEQALAKLQM